MSYINISNAQMQQIFKTAYLDLLSAPINRKYPIKSMISYDYKAEGLVQAHGVMMADVGGFSSGTIQAASDTKFLQTNYTLKNLYFRGRVDRKSIQLSKDPQGAFMEMMNLQMMGGKNTIDRNLERMLVQGGSDGSIGTIDSGGVVDNGGGNYTLTISAATWVRDNFRIADLINVGTAGTSIFRVASADPTLRKVVVDRQSGSDVPLAADLLYRQGSRNQELSGLRGVLKATSGSLYGITVGDMWQSRQYDAGGKPITEGMLVELIYNIQQECGEAPDAVIVSHVQRKKLHELARNKAFDIVTKDAYVKDPEDGGNVNLGAYPHLVIDGKEIRIITSQHMFASEIFFVNFKHVTFRCSKKGEFVPGTEGLLHYEGALNGSDAYSLVWAQYAEVFIHPLYHGVIYNLSTTTETSYPS